MSRVREKREKVYERRSGCNATAIEKQKDYLDHKLSCKVSSLSLAMVLRWPDLSLSTGEVACKLLEIH